MDLAITKPTTNEERVCDSCMIKKTKCNRKKPTCSRCLENGWVCKYSSKKRKPGPMKGSSAGQRRAAQSRPHHTSVESLTGPQPQAEQIIPEISPMQDSQSSQSETATQAGSAPPSTRVWKEFQIIEAQRQTAPDFPPLVPQWSLSPEAEIDLLNVYLDRIQPLYPLFRRDNLLFQYSVGQVPQMLLAALFAVSATLSTHGDIVIVGSVVVGEHYSSIARKMASPLWTSEANASVDDLRAIFLLALYECRAEPSRRAWTTVGHLVRLCYDYGLHQVDNTENCSFYEAGITTPADLESWRYLWWCIYILDSCCNATVATPLNIDLDSLYTALPTSSVENWTSGKEIFSETRYFVRSSTEEVSSTVKGVSAQWLHINAGTLDLDTHFLIRVINTAQIRESFGLRQAVNQNPSGCFTQRWELLSNKLATTRLSLPNMYHDPRRKATLGEEKQGHALRLVNLLEITLSDLPVVLSKEINHQDQRDEWLANWDTMISLVERIIEVIKNWDPNLFYLMDPCVSYIVFIAIVITHINTMLEMGQRRTAKLAEFNQSSWSLLHLFLQQLGTYWLLPKALYHAAERFKAYASTPLSVGDAEQLLNTLKKPLNFRHRREGAIIDWNMTGSIEPPMMIDNVSPEFFQYWLPDLDQTGINFG